MRHQNLGDTVLTMSVLFTGGWAIGGKSFDSLGRSDPLGNFARAEELGCDPGRHGRRPRTTRIGLSQVHWFPTDRERQLYEKHRALEEAEKVPVSDVSLRSQDDINDVLSEEIIEGIQVTVEGLRFL